MIPTSVLDPNNNQNNNPTNSGSSQGPFGIYTPPTPPISNPYLPPFISGPVITGGMNIVNMELDEEESCPYCGEKGKRVGSGINYNCGTYVVSGSWHKVCDIEKEICTCDITLLVNKGCKCGQFQREMERKKKLEGYYLG